MYGAYLSFAQLKEYLKIFVDNGMLPFDEKTTIYRTKDIGRNFILRLPHERRVLYRLLGTSGCVGFLILQKSGFSAKAAWVPYELLALEAAGHLLA
jgi:hypothetical protein